MNYSRILFFVAVLSMIVWACPGLGSDVLLNTTDPLHDLGIFSPYPHSIDQAVIKLFIHRLRSPTNPGLDQNFIDSALQKLSDRYRPIGISFVVTGQEDLVWDDFDDPCLQFLDLWDEVSTDEVIDIYFHLPTTTCMALGSSKTVISTSCYVVGQGITNDSSLIHEIGHCLGLHHTHERVFGLNSPGGDCVNLGDLVCETAPVPFSAISDFATDNCGLDEVFHQNYPDWDPDPRNIMSYGPDTCRTIFEPEQVDRMYAALEFHPELQPIQIFPSVSYEAPSNPQATTGLQYNGTPYSTIGWNFNDDEFMDLFISISDYSSVLYKGDYRQSDGTPHFSEVAEIRYDGGSPQQGLRGLAAGDYDGNGYEDLFAAHATNPRLYTWTKSTDRFKNEAVAAGLETWATASTAGAWGNYDDDSHLDLFVSRAANYVEEPLYYEDPLAVPTGSRLLVNVAGAGGTRVFVPAPGTNLPDNIASTSASWADYDGDGDQDLFVCSPLINGSGSHLFRNEGDNSFFDNTLELQAVAPLQYVNACSWNDMNNDGLVDLVASRYNAGPAIFYQDGNGGFQGDTSENEFFEFGDSGGNPGLVVADFNGDSFLDILGLSSSDTKAPVLYENLFEFNGTYGFYALSASAGLGDPGYTHGAVAHDFGGPDASNPEPDGLPDLYFGRPVDTNKFYFKATPNAGSSADLHFVKIKLNSTNPMDNTTGIGASVSVSAGGQQQIAIVDGGSMRGSQAGRTLLFGLGQYSGAVTATVNWPSGLIQTDVPVFMDQTTVIENSAVVVDDNTVVGSYTMQADGLVEWKFTWETNAPGNPALDKVEFDTGGLSPDCVPSLSEIFLGVSPDVKLSYTPKAGGGYTHVMTWENQPCVPFCNIPFYVTSGTNVQFDSSNSAKYLRVRICMSN